jgi:hypothetical protein
MIPASCKKHGPWSPDANIICPLCYEERRPKKLTPQDYWENDRLTKSNDYAHRYKGIKPPNISKSLKRKVLLLS